MKNYLYFENDLKKMESELEKLKNPYNEGGLIFEYPNLKNLAVAPEIPLSIKYLIEFFPKS